MSGEAEQPLRLHVVDDHPIWRDGVARDLAEAGLAVIGTASDGAQALRVAAATRPQVVLLDLHLPDLPGAALIRQLLLLDPSIRILVLSASGERQDVLDAMTAGATGYLVKSAQLGELLAAVRSVAKGDPVFTPGLAGLVLGEYRRLAAGGAAGPALAQGGAAGPELALRWLWAMVADRQCATGSRACRVSDGPLPHSDSDQCGDDHHLW